MIIIAAKLSIQRGDEQWQKILNVDIVAKSDRRLASLLFQTNWARESQLKFVSRVGVDGYRNRRRSLITTGLTLLTLTLKTFSSTTSRDFCSAKYNSQPRSIQ